MSIKIKNHNVIKIFSAILIIGMIFYSCGRQVSVTPPDAPPPNGYVYIDSYPKGFDIYLDGRDRRRMTPDSLTWLKTGTYTITLKKKLFRDSTFTVDVIEGKKKKIYIDFSKNLTMLGNLSCDSKPQGAEIFINDSSIGRYTPANIYSILPGNYTIRFHLKNYQDATRSITISSSKVTNTSATLIDTTIWTYYNTDNSAIKTNNLTCLDIDKDGVIWIGTDDQGVLSFNNNVWGGTEVYAILPAKHINCITVDKNNMKFFGTPKGFVTFDGASSHMYGFKSSDLPDFDIEAIEFDSSGNWYIGTHGGLTQTFMLNGVRIWNTYSIDVIPDNWITSLFYDNSGYLWIGTRNQGIVKSNLDKKWVRIYTGNSPLRNNYIRTITQAPSGDIWVGFGTDAAFGAQLAFYDGNSWQNSYVIPSNSQTAAIFIDKNNTKWIATDQGLIKFSQSSNIVTFNYDNTGLNINNVTGIAQDSKGNLWISTFGGGLVKYKGNH